MSTLTSADMVQKRSSTQVSQAPGGKSTFSLAWDEPAAPAPAEPVEGEEENLEEEEEEGSVPATGYKANQLKGTTSSIFSGGAAPSSGPVRASKTMQSSIEFGASAPAPSSVRTSKVNQSSIDFGGPEPTKVAPRVTPTHQSQVFASGDESVPQVSPKMTNKSLVSTLSLASDEAPPPTGRVRQAPGGKTSIVLG